MKIKKPVPPLVAKKKAGQPCPVCGMASYSLGGIHPQCASEQADAPRIKRMKAAKKTEKAKEKSSKARALSPWQKSCPKCRTLLHVRTLVCRCGYQFPKLRKAE